MSSFNIVTQVEMPLALDYITEHLFELENNYIVTIIYENVISNLFYIGKLLINNACYKYLVLLLLLLLSSFIIIIIIIIYRLLNFHFLINF